MDVFVTRADSASSPGSVWFWLQEILPSKESQSMIIAFM